MNKNAPIPVLHSSDWHLGNQLHEHSRDEEFAAFANWLVDELTAKEVQVLLIAGDIFDVRAPSREAQNFYYSTMARLAQLKTQGAALQHVVITSGNHDSSKQLQLGAQLLEQLDIHVICDYDLHAPEKNLLSLCGGALQVFALPYVAGADVVENFCTLPSVTRAAASHAGPSAP